MKPKILLVEDDDSMRQLLTDILSGDYDIVAYAHCDEGLVCLRHGEKFDAVWTDCDNPTPYGGALIAEETRKQLPGIPVIVASGNTDHKRVRDTCKANAYLAKPFGINDALDILERCIARPAKIAT